MLFSLLAALLRGMDPSVTFELAEPCSTKLALQRRIDASGTNVGALTVKLLEEANIPFLGNAEGMNSIFGTPTGLGALEVLSEKEMRSFGWCYEVNGRQPDQMPSAITLRGGEIVRWFFGYALYRDGQWVTYCEPSHHAGGGQVCP